MSAITIRPTSYGWFEVVYPETMPTAQAGLVYSAYPDREQAEAAAHDLQLTHRCDHQFCPVCIERVKREDVEAVKRHLPHGYEIVDGEVQPRHMTGQFCECEECTGEDPALAPTVDQIVAYEQGELDEDEIVELFAVLVETGMAWQLQGHYGRTAMALIEAGLIGARA
jgi:hypothetical protein